MSELFVYETLFQLIGETWEWAYEQKDEAVSYLNGACDMASKMIETMKEKNC